jgi:tetratricopeptide (TPR) repeat protein
MPALLAALFVGCGAGSVDIPLPELQDSEAVVVEAVERAVAAVENDPRSVDAWMRLGDRLRAHEWEPEAARCYGTAEALDPDEFLWPYLRGLCVMETDVAAAAEALARAIEIDPRYAPAHVHYGRALVDLGRIAEAREHFERATRIDRQNAHAWSGLGRCEMADENYASARKHLERAVTVAPWLGEAHHLLAQTYLALGEDELAASHSETARTLPKKTAMNDPRTARPVEPVGSRANNDRGILLSRERRDEEAEGHFREALRINPEFAEAHYNLGTVLARTGRTDEAIAHLSDAVRLGPDHADAQVNLAVALGVLGDTEESERRLREALRVDPDHPAAHLHLGALEASRGETDSAIRHYREALSARPDWHEPAWRLAWILATHPDSSVRDGAEAVRLAEMACRASSFRHAPSVDALGAAYAEVGRFKDAAIAARKAARLLPGGVLEEEARERAALYDSGRPYRE